MSLQSMGRMILRDGEGQVKYRKCCFYRGGKHHEDCIKPPTMFAVDPGADGFRVVEMGRDRMGIVQVVRVVAVLRHERDADAMARRLMRLK